MRAVQASAILIIRWKLRKGGSSDESIRSFIELLMTKKPSLEKDDEKKMIQICRFPEEAVEHSHSHLSRRRQNHTCFQCEASNVANPFHVDLWSLPLWLPRDKQERRPSKECLVVGMLQNNLVHGRCCAWWASLDNWTACRTCVGLGCLQCIWITRRQKVPEANKNQQHRTITTKCNRWQWQADVSALFDQPVPR